MNCLPIVLAIDGPLRLFNDPPPIAFDCQTALMAVNVAVAESRSTTLVVFQVNGIENMDGPPSFFVAVEPDGQPVRKAGEPLFVAEPGDQLQCASTGGFNQPKELPDEQPIPRRRPTPRRPHLRRPLLH